jgi:hypothetical protein
VYSHRQSKEVGNKRANPTAFPTQKALLAKNTKRGRFDSAGKKFLQSCDCNQWKDVL